MSAEPRVERGAFEDAGDPPVDDLPPEWPTGFVSSPVDREALAVLLGLGSVTPRRLLRLAQRERTASRCLAAVVAGRIGGPSDRARARGTSGRELLEAARGVGARFVTVQDEEYPSELLELNDPPAGLFVVGGRLDELSPRVAMVGARGCSPTGRDLARMFGTALDRAGLVVVSGGARGIDGASHEGALAGSGRTIAVLGSGIDVWYPATHRALFERIVEHGALVSEYPPGVPAEPFRFPARNRIIAALCRGTLVVEGAQGSGSMITAEHALDLGRDVFAVPGPVTSELSFAPNHLIREGAGLVTSPEELLQDLGLDRPSSDEDVTAVSRTPEGLSQDEESVWRAIRGATTLDILAADSRIPAPRVLEIVTSLEVRGLVRSVGGRFDRAARWS